MTAALPEAIRAAGTPIEVWFQDEARVGQQGTLTYVWAEMGNRPRALKDLRYEWAYLFSAVCAERAALVLLNANASAMMLHLAEVSRQVAPDAHAVLVCDGAGWRKSGRRLRVPENITLLHLPPYSPELNPVENIWECLHANKLSYSVFDTYNTIVDRCCTAWNWLMDAPDRIRSLATTPWIKRSKHRAFHLRSEGWRCRAMVHLLFRSAEPGIFACAPAILVPSRSALEARERWDLRAGNRETARWFGVGGG